MAWQKLTDHLNGKSVRVESKSGNQYVAEAETKELGSAIYNQLINRAHDSKTYWAWVEFPEDGQPVVKDYKPGDMPTSPPWEHP